MALIGGGGAGNVAGGSNPSGTGASLNYIGDYAYAHSGSVSVDNNITTLCDFTTANNILVATIQNFYAGVSTGSQPNPNVQFQTKFNGEIVTSYVTFDSATDNAVKVPIEIIIPPYTRVTLTGINAETTATIQLLAIIKARVYA
jgi:TPP-dependent indolepyruvate ferredoxin oxidoreductase alpha subunit